MPTITPPSTVTALAEDLRRRILDGTLASGAHLREAELVSVYGVARHSVRAAIQALAADGIVRHTPNKGAYVPELGPDDVVDVFRLRAAVESEAIRQIIGGRLVPAAAGRAVEALDALAEDSSWDRVVDVDLAFHTGVVADAASPRLARVFASAKAEIELCLVQLRPHYDRPSQVAAEHRDLLTALRGLDLAAAHQAFRRHWDDAVTNLLATLAERRG